MAIIDFHNHLMPGVDDGAQTMQEVCAALTAFAAEDVNTIITTPHLQGSLLREPRALAARLARLDSAWAQLLEHVHEHHPLMTLQRGVELMLDVPLTSIPDDRLRLAGGRYVLVEFPFMTIPPRSAEVLAALCQKDLQPILAHPERYAGLTPDLSLAERWRESGALLQVTGGSLLGRYGSQARKYAMVLLERGWVDYLSSDYHARGFPQVGKSRELLVELGAGEQAALLTEINPARILTGEPPLPVPPVPGKRMIWERVAELFRVR
jgi:protein-tyrosine phosphatase